MISFWFGDDGGGADGRTQFIKDRFIAYVW